MVGVHLARNLPRIGKLAWIARVFFVIANRESDDGLAAALGKQRGIGAGVHTAEEKHADGDIADFAELNASTESGPAAFGNLLLTTIRPWLRVFQNTPFSKFLNLSALY